MKINIMKGSADSLSGFTQVSPQDDYLLDSICEDGEAEIIVAADCIDFIAPDKADEALKNWCKKVRRGGILVIGGTDAYEAARGLTNFIINLDEFNTLIHGSNGDRLASYTCKAICDYLTEMGMKMMKKRVNGFSYTVEAVRQ